MGPKKKKGNKKSGKKKSAQKSVSGDITGKLNDVFNEVSKEFYLVQIRDLELKISRYQEKCDKLEIRNKEVESNFEQQASDKKEIVNFLKKQLKERSDEIADLQEKQIGLQQAKDIEKDKYELELTTIKAQMQEVKDQLQSENMVLGGKLASLEEFRVQKEDLLNKFAEMEELLKSQEVEHKEQIYQLERKAVVDKDRLKKEMILRVNTVAAEFRKVSNKQMADTTKRAIRENVLINTQLSKMSDKTMDMITENDDMKFKEKSQKQQIEILEDNEKELMKRNATNQKVIRMLSEKAKTQETQIKEYQLGLDKYLKLQKEMKETTESYAKIREELRLLNGEKISLKDECEHVIENQEELQEDKDYLVGILSDATSVIKHALQHNSQSEDDAITELKNTNLLYKVIDILNLAAEMGVGIDPNELVEKRKAQKAKVKPYINLGPLKINKVTKRHSRGSPVSPAFKQPLGHYRLGDLGIVPSGPSIRREGRSSKEGNMTCYTKEQLAKGTPTNSTYDLVKDNSIKLPALSSLS